MDAKMNRVSYFPGKHAPPQKAEKIIRRIFRSYPGSLAIRLGDSRTVVFGRGAPAFTLVFRRLAPFRNMILFGNPLQLAEAYFRQWLDIEGDIYAALGLRTFLESLELPIDEKLQLWFSALAMEELPEVRGGASRTWTRPLTMLSHSRRMNRDAISFHYDVSNEFYRLWLDKQMVYSCAYFEHAGDSLEQAQQNKLDLICRKLQLAPGERFLDIGCGWGALVIWAAKHYGVSAHGVTLSRKQYDLALQRIREENLEGQVTVELKDYRDIAGEAAYDKIASVGMFEHVGLKNLPVYFSTVYRLLKPGGLFLNHGITQDVEGGSRTVGSKFIARYVFPDGELDRISNIERVMERCQFEIHDVESLRPHYALTLRQWVSRLERQYEEALNYVPESVYRIWRMYMAGCALQFENGEVGVYQVLAAKRNGKPLGLPLTRSYITQSPTA